MKTNLSDLWKKEDWLAVWIGFAVIAIACIAVLTGAFDFAVGVKLQGGKIKEYIPAFLVLFVLSVLVRVISAEFTLNRYLEWAFWALIVGLLISNTVGVPKWLKPAIRTEFYIKTGLVIMGFSVLFSNIAKFGLYGLGIAWIVTIRLRHLCGHRHGRGRRRQEERPGHRDFHLHHLHHPDDGVRAHDHQGDGHVPADGRCADRRYGRFHRCGGPRG